MNEIQNNENLFLKKRLNICRTVKGTLVKIPDELIIDVIKAWERWSGNAKSFYSSIGLNKHQLASIIKKGKRLFKEGKKKLGPFVPVEIKPTSNNCDKIPIILKWDDKKYIRFYQVSHLIEFLKNVA